MQKRLLLLSGVLSAMIILSAGCGKDDDPPPAPKTKTQLLTQGSWKFEKIEPALAESYITCFKDNTITFAADGSGTCPDAGAQCNPPTGNFNWNFTDNETKIHLNTALIPSGSQDFTIVTLNETNLVASQTITSPLPGTITITFKH